MQRLFITVSLVFALTACANPINQHNAARYHELGRQAELAGDYKAAEGYYGRTLANARIGRSPDAGISMAAYNLGRVKGHLCMYDEAEQLLLEALQLEEKVTGPDSAVTSMRLFELARLHFDQQHYDQAGQYYARALPIVKKLGVESRDPIALADAIEEYSVALKNLGKNDEAQKTKQEADQLRKASAGKSAKFVPVRYKCSGKA